MSEFDKLKDDAEQYARDHPQQVHEAEQDAEHAAESKIDPGKQEQDSPRDNNPQDNSGQQGQRDDSDRYSSQSDQDHDQDQSQSQGR
jgi:hypothetical protein